MEVNPFEIALVLHQLTNRDHREALSLFLNLLLIEFAISAWILKLFQLPDSTENLNNFFIWFYVPPVIEIIVLDRFLFFVISKDLFSGLDVDKSFHQIQFLHMKSN